MKKITLFFALSFVSLLGFSQESKNTTDSTLESIERQTEYIIVLDDVTVNDNIDLLLTGTQVSKEIEFDFDHHELVHDAPDNFDIESKFVEGAFSYNEYAMNYDINSDHSGNLRS